MAGLRERARESARALGDVFRNANLRRVQLAWVGSQLGDWGWTVALSVVAYGVGGTAAVGILGLVRTLPAGISAPFTAVLADRYPRERVMFATTVVRAALLTGAAVAAAAEAPFGLLLAIAGLTFLVSTAFRPAQAALVPSLAATPEELTAANVSSSTIESLGMFAGPALGGVLLALTSPWVVFAVTAGMFGWSSILVARVHGPEALEPEEREEGSLAQELVAGFRAVAVEPGLRLLMAILGAQTLVCGALDVLVVVVALRLLHTGDGGVGFLFSAIGVGGLLGAAA